MKRKKIWCVVIFSTVLLLFILIYLMDINKIENENSNVEILGEKVLILKEGQDNVSIPHFNIKGMIKKVDSNYIDIEFSNYAKSFLETNQISVENHNFDVVENERVFIKFNIINIQEKDLKFSTVEIYKYIPKFEINNAKNDFFVCLNDYGGIMRVNGKSFKYNNDLYFKSNYNLSENDEEYFVNVRNGKLLTEEYKSIVFPFKIYNMINPQETKFFEILEIYT